MKAKTEMSVNQRIVDAAKDLIALKRMNGWENVTGADLAPLSAAVRNAHRIAASQEAPDRLPSTSSVAPPQP